MHKLNAVAVLRSLIASTVLVIALSAMSANAASCINPIEMRRISSDVSQVGSSISEQELLLRWASFSREMISGLRCVQSSANSDISDLAGRDIAALQSIEMFSNMLMEHDQDISTALIESISDRDFTALDLGRSAILALYGRQRRDAIEIALFGQISEFISASRIEVYLGYWEQKDGCTDDDFERYVRKSIELTEGIELLGGGLDVLPFLFHSKYQDFVPTYLYFIESALELDHPILLETEFSRGFSQQPRDFSSEISSLDEIRDLYQGFPDALVLSREIEQEDRYIRAISEASLGLREFPNLSGLDVAKEAIFTGAVLCRNGQASDVRLTTAEDWLRYCSE